MARRRRSEICTYCDRPGIGSPPLCRHHYEEVHYGGSADPEFDPGLAEEVIDRIIDHPRVQDILSAFNTRVNQVFDGVFAARAEAVRRAAAPGRAFPTEWPPPPPRGRRAPHGARQAPPPGSQRTQPPPPPHPPPPPPQDDPRVILGFPPGSRPTRDQIKRRRRELARLFHSDAGGSDESMRRVNDASERLISQIYG